MKKTYHNYHRFFLEDIKHSNNLSYISYERYKDRYQIKTKRGKQVQYFFLEGKPEDVTPQFYNDLKSLVGKAYGQI